MKNYQVCLKDFYDYRTCCSEGNVGGQVDDVHEDKNKDHGDVDGFIVDK